MRTISGNNVLCGLTLTFMLIATGCGRKADLPRERTAEQILGQQLADAKNKLESEQRKAQKESELKNATPAQIRGLVSQCKSDVLKAAKLANRSPFDVFLIDEYSADIYQAAAYVGGGSVQSEAKKIEQALKARKAGDPYFESMIPLSHTVMFTHDTFSGPRKEPKRYGCFIELGLALTVYP